MRRLYGVNDERTQMAKIRYLQMKDDTQRLICRTGNRDKLFEVMICYGVHEKLVRLIERIYDGSIVNFELEKVTNGWCKSDSGMHSVSPGSLLACVRPCNYPLDGTSIKKVRVLLDTSMGLMHGQLCLQVRLLCSSHVTLVIKHRCDHRREFSRQH